MITRDRDEPLADVELLRRASRRSVLHVSLGMAGVLLIVGATTLFFLFREQNDDFDRTLHKVVAAADDVDDPPPDMLLAELTPDGQITLTAGTSEEHAEFLIDAVQGPDREFNADEDDAGGFRVVVGTGENGNRFAVAGERKAMMEQRWRYIELLILAEGTAFAGAVATAALLRRRSVRPLAQALQLQRQFVADASHELRTPLTVLHTRAQLLQVDPAVRKNDRLRSEIDDLVNDTRSLGEVIEDLLASAELQRSPGSMTIVDIAELARQAITTMRPIASDRGLGIELIVDVERICVRGHRTALRRALIALIDNAIAHADRRVSVAVRRAGGQVVVEVADDGPGVDPAVVDSVFDRHAKGDHGDGTRFGIGLALVRHIVDAHHGSITSNSRPEGGAVFCLALPRVEPSRSPTVEPDR